MVEYRDLPNYMYLMPPLPLATPRSLFCCNKRFSTIMLHTISNRPYPRNTVLQRPTPCSSPLQRGVILLNSNPTRPPRLTHPHRVCLVPLCVPNLQPPDIWRRLARRYPTAAPGTGCYWAPAGTYVTAMKRELLESSTPTPKAPASVRS